MVQQSDFKQRGTYKNRKCENFDSIGCTKIRGLGDHTDRD